MQGCPTMVAENRRFWGEGKSEKGNKSEEGSVPPSWSLLCPAQRMAVENPLPNALPCSPPLLNALGPAVVLKRIYSSLDQCPHFTNGKEM